MFFLLRCGFWLTVVFLTIFWARDPESRLSTEIAPKTRQFIGAAVEKAGAELAKTCLNAPAACLRAAGAVNDVADERRAPGKPRPAQKEPADRP